MAYALQFETTDTIATGSSLLSGATNTTLTNGNFGSPSGVQLYVVDYDIPGTAELISATISGTAITGITRGLAGGAPGTTNHNGGAKIISAFVPQHYDRVANRTLGYAQDITSAQTGITAAVDLTGLVVTVTSPSGGARLKITASVYGRTSVAGDVFGLSVFEGATQLAYDSQWLGDTTNKKWSVVISFVATAGSHTYKLNFGRTSGSGTWTNAASATGPNSILVENIE